VINEVDVLRALAHPVRWGIMMRLAAEPEICACDFTEFFDVAQPTISAHLKVLREAGLVTSERKGTTICYSVDRDRVAWLAGRLGALAAPAPAGARAQRSSLPRIAVRS
jgi:ArsR family transcriptional regulator, arsenate/arsenite/antimonite-responsive transcriptional repressor